MKKTTLFIMAAMVLLMMGLAGCTGVKLPESFDEDAVREQAKKVIDCINTDNLEELSQLPMVEEMKTILMPESMQAILAQYVGGRGEFVKYEAVTVVGTTDQDGTEYALAVTVAEYENQKVTYTITFNQEMEIAGFFLK